MVSEKNGVWGQAIAVPGLVALNQAGPAAVTQVSCGSAGNCVAGGSYSDSVSHQQGFVAIEKNGVWGQAIEVPGLAAAEPGRTRGGHVGILRLGPVLRCRRVLHRQLR